MSATKRVNVLVYTGPGTSLGAVRHATWSLRRLLGSHHAVVPVTAEQLRAEPWPASCALLVMPGGADVPYDRELRSSTGGKASANSRIIDYVRAGGKYLGFCAGGYYGSARCEFEEGRKGWEVVAERELAFFPGIARGLAFPGFVYDSEAGARAVELKVNSELLVLKDGEKNEAIGVVPGSFHSYYNGGGTFVDAEKLADRGVEVLAQYQDELAVDSGEGKANAAVVYCPVGDGAAILTGPHPEFAPENLNRNEQSNPNYGMLIDTITASDDRRVAFMKACLSKLGLHISREIPPVPSLSPIHLSAAIPSDVAELLSSWRAAGILAKDATNHQHEYIRGELDTFCIHQPDSTLVSPSAAVEMGADSSSSSRNPDSDAERVQLTLRPHTATLPVLKETPHFNHSLYFSTLTSLHASSPGFLSNDYGRILLYGEVLNSTNTLLDKNTSLLSHLPIGTTAVATTQLAGRGRGANVWVSPPVGSLLFSLVQRHPISLTSAPVVFVQYLAGLAVVAAVRDYAPGWAAMPVRLKWPNDIYALDPDAGEYRKIAGVLVSSSYAGAEYTLVTGVGINVDDTANPTTSLARVAKAEGLLSPGKGISHEVLLAGILVQFERLYARFCMTGFDREMERLYYDAWLHSGQVVTVAEEVVEGDGVGGNRSPGRGGVRARILGITTDWGLLVAEEVDERGHAVDGGRRFAVQSDANSFDFFQGLVRRKI